MPIRSTIDPEWIIGVPRFQKQIYKLHAEWAISFISTVSFITFYSVELLGMAIQHCDVLCIPRTVI